LHCIKGYRIPKEFTFKYLKRHQFRFDRVRERLGWGLVFDLFSNKHKVIASLGLMRKEGGMLREANSEVEMATVTAKQESFQNS
jgi:hypothetical protein